MSLPACDTVFPLPTVVEGDGALPLDGERVPASSLSIDVGVWPDGVIDWHLDEDDFPAVPAAQLSTAGLAADGTTWLDFAACVARDMPPGGGFNALESTADAVSTASEFSEGQVGLVLGAELGVDTRAGLPGLPTGIARPIEPRAGATTTVRPAIFQGW